MARRKGGEFSEKTKQASYARYDGKDAITGEPLGQFTEYDHIIGLAWARDNAPDVGIEQLKSAKNCRPLNRDTHKERHRNLDEQEVWWLVAFFRGIQNRLF